MKIYFKKISKYVKYIYSKWRIFTAHEHRITEYQFMQIISKRENLKNVCLSCVSIAKYNGWSFDMGYDWLRTAMINEMHYEKDLHFTIDHLDFGIIFRHYYINYDKL